VRSPQWDVFSDVSPEFAARASLVLDAAFLQAQCVLAQKTTEVPRIGARIFRSQRDYRAITGDESAGHWVPKLNSVLTFLDDPRRTDFDEFQYPILVHEAAHAAVSWCGLGGSPAWLNEGVACSFERIDPTRSRTVNRAATQGWFRRVGAARAAREAGIFPTLAELTAIRTGWDADDFGPVTRARYAAAESLVVALSQQPETARVLRKWIDAVRNRQDPVRSVGSHELAAVEREWRLFLQATCGSLPSER
jgi:hypothetical protein